MLNIALIGCGRIGRLHAEIVAANPRAKLAAIHDVSTPAVTAVAELTGAKVAESTAQLFADAQINAVIVASATSTHADFIEQAVKAGKPILCEKPIDLKLERVLACHEAVKDSHVPIQLGFNRRFDAGHRALRDAVAAGEIGDLMQIIITSRDPAPPSDAYVSTAGGLLRDMTIHDFDLARFMLGNDEPVSVWATGGALINQDLRDQNEIDCAMIVMTTASGKQICINNSRQAPYGYDQRVEVLGSKGMLQSANRTEHGLTRFTAQGTSQQMPYLHFFDERYRQAFVNQLDGFIDAVIAGTPASPSFDDGVKALVMAEAAYRALHSGRVASVERI